MEHYGGDVRILRDLEGMISREVGRLGILCRVFSRVKSTESIEKKIFAKGYAKAGRKLRDFFGVRVALYFSDDVDLAAEAIEKLFSKIEATVDLPGVEFFGPKRHNLVVGLPDWAKRECSIDWNEGQVDPTLEVQIRTVLSEGWHEIEHDLRYKAPEEWLGHEDLSRALNGILATAETCDWGVLQVLDELARRHYTANRWNAMLRTKFRLRFSKPELSDEVLDLISRTRQLQKDLFKFSRLDLLRAVLRRGAEFPLTLDNLCFAANRLGGFSQSLRRLEPASFSALMTRCQFSDLDRRVEG